MRLQSATGDRRRRPGIHTPGRGYGFRARARARPGMTAVFVALPTVKTSLRGLLHKRLAKTADLVSGGVGYGPEGQAVLAPVLDVIAIARLWGGGARGRGPDELVDEMPPASVDQRGDHPAADIIDPASHQGKPLFGQIDHRRRKVDLAV